ncbi:MAG: putative damage-inducible protein DinB [Planctomycetota bacterium]|jgi:uncharacterized damage-inducible protein DinB
MSTGTEYQYRGARASVILHKQALASFVATWRGAQKRSLALPVTQAPDYASLEHLLYHVVACARGYMVWMCESLNLPDPKIRTAPPREKLAAELDDYLVHLFEAWQQPLRDVDEQRFNECSDSSWGVSYCIDGMLEHAVMHPIRHEFQLKELMPVE